MKKLLHGAATLLLLSTLTTPLSTAHAQGTAFTYQGRLNDGANPASGIYDLRFTLQDAASAGVQIAGPLTNAATAITNGLFTVALDFGGGVFPGTNRWLEIAVRTNGGGAFTNLAPRQKITATPYAITAGTVTGLIPASQLSGAILPANIGPNTITGSMLSNATITATQLANNSVGSVQLADTIALGATNVTGQLDIFRTSANTPAISLFGSSSQISTYGSDGLEQIRLWGVSYGELILHNSLSNNATAVTLSAQGTTGGQLSLNNTNGSVRALLEGENTGGQLTLYQTDGQIGVFVDGDSSGSGLLTLRNTNGSTRLSLIGQSTTGGGGEISLNGTTGTQTVQILGQSATGLGAKMTMKQDTGNIGIILDAEYGSDGEGGSVLLNNGAGSLRLRLDGDFNDAGAAFFYKANGGSSVTIEESSNAGFLAVYNTNGLQKIILDGNDANGDGRITTQVLQITGGSDLSEQFQISGLRRAIAGSGVWQASYGPAKAGDRAPEPGDVVVIDSEQPGHLLVSGKRYDRTVAGIISGAGGVKTGMLMGQAGTKADGKQSVALTGRVFVKADASKGAIRPGDLLTTSDLPGHAMKVSDHGLAQGAILGKAMTALNEGTGMVLVLVTLQ